MKRTFAIGFFFLITSLVSFAGSDRQYFPTSAFPSGGGMLFNISAFTEVDLKVYPGFDDTYDESCTHQWYQQHCFTTYILTNSRNTLNLLAQPHERADFSQIEVKPYEDQQGNKYWEALYHSPDYKVSFRPLYSGKFLSAFLIEINKATSSNGSVAKNQKTL